MSLLIETKLKTILALACTHTILACEPPGPKPFTQAELVAGMSAGAVAEEIAGTTTVGGDMAGDEVSTVAGDVAGTFAGNTAGDVAGALAGSEAEGEGGGSAGDMAGNEAGTPAGEMAGGEAGTPAGEMAGDEAGTPARETAGDEAGTPAGEMAGDEAGTSAGDMAGIDLPTEPVEGCVGPTINSLLVTNSAADNQQDCVTCIGAEPPNFVLRDLNPNSCGVGQYYGIDSFQVQVTLVVLLRSTCGYCQIQLQLLEQMRFELLLEGHTIWLAIINETNTESNLVAFTNRSMSSILQDVAEVNAWAAMSDTQLVDQDDGQMVQMRVGGDKDDMYIYGTDGRLARFLDDDDREFSTNLSTPEGYMNLKMSLLEVLNQSTP